MQARKPVEKLHGAMRSCCGGRGTARAPIYGACSVRRLASGRAAGCKVTAGADSTGETCSARVALKFSPSDSSHWRLFENRTILARGLMRSRNSENAASKTVRGGRLRRKRRPSRQLRVGYRGRFCRVRGRRKPQLVAHGVRRIKRVNRTAILPRSYCGAVCYRQAWCTRSCV